MREVSWVPWELLLLAAAAQPSDTLTSYRTIYRPSPRLTRSGRSSAKQNVLIVRGGEALESQSERGYSIDTGQELAHVYARNNVRVRELTHPTPSGLQDALREPCRVIHIISGVRETRERLVLDFGDERFTSKDEARLTSSDIVRALYDQSTAPLLILQIVGSPSATELVRHLCLRNAFASELAAKARGVTILGTGLARGDGAQRLTEQIVTELADGLSIGSIVRGLWKGGITEQGGPDLIHNRTAVPLLGTVLFAHDPDEVFRIGDTSV